MGIRTVVSCDRENCNTEAEVPSGWFLGRLSVTTGTVTIQRFDTSIAEQFDVSVLCGEACVSKWVSEKLSQIG